MEIIIQISTDLTRSQYIVNAKCITGNNIWEFNGQNILDHQIYIYNSGETPPVQLTKNSYQGVVRLSGGGTAIVKIDNVYIMIEVLQK